MELFADRASRVDPGFALDGTTGPVIGQVAARLDGMPLAIELAAARVEALGLGQLLDRLDDRFTLLTSSARTAPARQRSLAATVDWSYQLLSDQEKQVFRRLAVFPGPFSLDAAETVAGPAAGPAVLKLVDCSLIAPPRTGPDGRGRYLMLETLRAFGLERLTEVGEQPGAEALLAQHMLAVAEQAAAAMDVGPETAAEYALVLTTTPHQEVAQAPPELGRLSTREQELVTLVARGSTDAQIAAQLYISISTVRSHLDRIRDKTSCRRRADLTRLALQTGLV